MCIQSYNTVRNTKHSICNAIIRFLIFFPQFIFELDHHLHVSAPVLSLIYSTCSVLPYSRMASQLPLELWHKIGEEVRVLHYDGEDTSLYEENSTPPLHKMVLICKYLQAVATQYLYEEIDLRSLQRTAQFISRAQMEMPLQAQHPSLPALHYVSTLSVSNLKDPAIIQGIVSTIPYLPQLQCLEFDTTNSHPSQNNETLDACAINSFILHGLLPGNPNQMARTLSLNRLKTNCLHLGCLMAKTHSIQHLAISTKFHLDEMKTIQDTFSHSSIQTTAITALSLSLSSNQNAVMTLLKRISAACPHLVKLLVNIPVTVPRYYATVYATFFNHHYGVCLYNYLEILHTY